MKFRHIQHPTLIIFIFVCAENRYKHEVLVDGEPVLFEILDTCPKVRQYLCHSSTYIPKLYCARNTGLH